MQLDDYLAYKPQRRAKFVIYTAISGDFDDLIQHTYVSKDADYVCYTDQVVPHPGIWEIRPLEAQHLDRVRSARFYKLFAHTLFPAVRFSVWIDGNIDVLNDALERSVDVLIAANTLVATNIHFSRSCTYAEALVCRNALLDDSAVILEQIAYLEQQQFPHNHGLFETNMMFRDHHQPGNISLMQSWWDMIVRFSRRDQLSFGFALFQNQLSCAQLFPANPRLGTDFVFRPHHKKMLSTLYIDTGDGFVEHQIWPGDGVIKSSNEFSVAFERMPFKGVKQLRFDPVDGQFCLLGLESLTVTLTNGSEKTLAFADIQAQCQSNGVQTEDGLMAFDSFDPHITLPLVGNITRLVIQGQLKHVLPGAKIDVLAGRAAQASALLASLTLQHADLLTRFDATITQNELLGQSLVQQQQKVADLAAQVSDLQARVQAMLASRIWRAGRALLWLPKVLFKRG